MNASPPFAIAYTGDYLGEDGKPAIADIGLDRYAGHPSITVDFLRDQAPTPGDTSYQDRLYSLEITPRQVASADGIVIFRPWVKASAFAEGAERLTVIGRAGAGIDKIDLDACTANDVAVFNAPDSLTHATASSAFLLMLALAKRLPEQERMVRDGRWDRQAETMGIDLPGKTLGIVGLGASGRELARLASAWGMTILAFSPRASQIEAAHLGVTLVESLDDLFAGSDFVSLHNRLDARTRGLVTAAHFRRMKPSAYFVNVARGEIVDQAALVTALRDGWIAGAGLDVFEHEPLPQDDPLVTLPNVILTPHWLPSTRDAARLTMTLVADGMIRVAQGLLPDTIVNPAVLERPGFQAKLARFALPSES
ncbi:MAG: NAD(P)-dependent oxidoreductase [Candidatus Kaistia colombiensis]|nr:MAG: NAD(P)-dependent oxidoreductase [Kaistia sp.]